METSVIDQQQEAVDKFFDSKPEGSVLVIGVLFVSLNLLADALYRVFDPRAAA